MSVVLVVERLLWVNAYLRARVAAQRPAEGPVGVLLKKGVLLLNPKPELHRRLVPFVLGYRYGKPEYTDHGSSSLTSGWLKIFAATCRLLLGIGSPFGA